MATATFRTKKELANKVLTNQENVVGTRNVALKNQVLQKAGNEPRRPISRRPALGDIRNRAAENNVTGAKKELATAPIVKPDIRKPLRTVNQTKNLVKKVGTASGITRNGPGGKATDAPRHKQEKGQDVQKKASENANQKPIVTRSSSNLLPGTSSGATLTTSPRTEEFKTPKASSSENVSMMSVSEGKAANDDVEPMDKSMSEAFSENAISAVPNIDEGDEENPLFVSEYVADIYKYLRFLEQKTPIRENFLTKNQVTYTMRAVLIDWLVQVQIRFRLLPETLYMTVSTLDRYLQDVPVTKSDLQLVGVSCMLVSSKYEEIYAPEIEDFVYITDKSCSKESIRAREIDILTKLDFSLGRPLAIHFLRRFSKAAEANSEHHSLAKYLCETSLLDHTITPAPPSCVAAAATFIALKLFSPKTGRREIWDDVMRYYTGYSESQIQPVVQKMVKYVHKINALAERNRSCTKYQAVRKKFASNRFMQCSMFEEIQNPSLAANFDI